MTDDPHNIILDHLRYLRTRADSTDESLRELKNMFIGLREDVHGLRGDMLRQERALATVESDIDRIKNRLDLSDGNS